MIARNCLCGLALRVNLIYSKSAIIILQDILMLLTYTMVSMEHGQRHISVWRDKILWQHHLTSKAWFYSQAVKLVR